MASEYSALGSSPQESAPLPRGVRRLKVPVSREQYPRVSILGISLTGLVATAMLFGKPGRRYWSKDLRPALTLNSDLQVGAYEVISQGSCRSRGLFPILRGHECKAAAETLHLLLNSSSLLTTELAAVPEGCYYCHNFEDKTYTLWLGTNAKSRGHGAETSQRLKTRQPICRKTALSTTAPVFSCEMGDHWRDVWSEDQKHFCCRSHGKGCASGSGSSSSADSTKATTTTAPTTLPWGPVHEWEVTSPAGVVVRGKPCDDCSVERTKAQYEVFAGRQQGSWIRLVGESGFVLQHHKGADLAVMAPKYYLVRLHNERCASLGRVPIHDMRECGMAARAMGLSVTQPSDTSKAPTPEGCYYFKHHGSESLWLNTNAENRGRGASVWPGRERLPLCALPLRTTTSVIPPAPTAAPTAPPEKRGRATPVTIFMTLRNLEYNRLLTTPNLATLIVAQVKKVVLGTLDKEELREEHVQVILSAGSVEVSATVVPPLDVNSKPLREKLDANARPCCRELARKLADIKAIADVATGSLDCSNVTVADSPGARISLSSPAPLTTSTVASTSTGTTLTTTSVTATSTVTKATSSTRTVSETTATSTGTTTTVSRTTTPEPTTTATATATTLASTSTSTRTTRSSSTATRTETATTATRTATSTSPTATTTLAPSSTRTTGTTLRPSTTATTMTVPASQLLRPREGGEDGSKWDCGGDQIVERGWSQEQQHYCCAHHGRGCFDCLAGRSHWQVGWAAEKKRYCCKTAGVGCGFDCSSGPWTQSRRVWCCVHRNIQCEAKLPARPTAAASDEELPSDATGAVKKGDYNCYDNDPDVWPPAKRHWCCMHRDKGCSSRPFDCQAELQSWQVSWSQDKVDWCCRFEQLGCPMYDCGVGLGNAETAWSQGKKAWCCRTQHLGCPKPYNCHDGMENYFVHWSEEKRKWCCATEKLGCLVPYRCKASADLWETGWSARKKAWCCEHQKICPRLWDCTTGASNWEVEWSRAQQTWCCRHHNVGCGYNCDSGQEDQATWSFRERLWCCQYRGIACAASEKFRAG